jgi:tetratricopeptide (TPR) repeat protein
MAPQEAVALLTEAASEIALMESNGNRATPFSSLTCTDRPGRYGLPEARQGLLRALRALILTSLFLALWLSDPKLAGCFSDEAQVAAHFRAGQEALKQGELDRAVEEFKRVLALKPGLLEAEANLGLAYHGMGEFELAANYLSKVLGQRPDLPGLGVILGIDYVKMGAVQKAISVLEEALRLDPSSREGRRALATCYLDQNNFGAAASEFRRVAALDPDKARAWFILGHDYLDLSARLAYRGARLYARSAWGHRFLGDMLIQRSRWEDAADEYRQGLEIEPRQPGLHTALGRAYLQGGKLEKAETEFQLELQADPKNEEAWLGLGEVQLARGYATGALQAVGRVWEISPEFLALQERFPDFEPSPEKARTLLEGLRASPQGPCRHFLLSRIYEAAGQTQQARTEWISFQAELKIWQDAQHQETDRWKSPDPCRAHRPVACANWLRSRRPQTPSQQLLLGKTLFALREYERAADSLARLLTVAKGNAEASYWLARSYQALGAECFDRLEESFPDSWRTHQLRAESYALRGSDNEAIKEYEAALLMQPNEAELHEALGELFLNRKSYEEARVELEKSLALDSSRARTLYLLGRLYLGKHETEKAVPYLQNALRRQPSLIEASRLLGTAYVRLKQFGRAVPELTKAAPFDFYGDVHYQLSIAFRNLGKVELAEKALARSEELRRTSAARHQAIVSGVAEVY